MLTRELPAELLKIIFDAHSSNAVIKNILIIAIILKISPYHVIIIFSLHLATKIREVN